MLLQSLNRLVNVDDVDVVYFLSHSVIADNCSFVWKYSQKLTWKTEIVLFLRLKITVSAPEPQPPSQRRTPQKGKKEEKF